MSIETQWFLEPSVLVQRFVGKPNLNEFDDASQALSRYAPRNRKFHIIGDLSQLGQLPDELHNIGENLNNVLSRSQLGWFVTFGAHDVALNFAAALMPHFTRLQHKHFQNQEDAFDFLSMMDASLPISL
jgi:hypothetical protein